MRKTISIILFSVLCCLHFTSSYIYAEKVNFIFEISGIKGENQKEFNNIQGITTDSMDNVYIVDSDNHRVQVFSGKGVFLYQFGKKGKGNGEFNTPFGIAVNDHDEIYVSEHGNNRIQIFDNSGKFLFTFGQKGNQKGEFNSPSGIAIDLFDFVYVADSGNDRVQVFTRQGIFITSFGSSGNLPTQFNYPSYVAVDNNRNIFIVDKNNNRIQVLDPLGYFLLDAGNNDSKKFKQLFSTAVSKSGIIYVTDIKNNCIHAFSNTGEFLYSFGSKGSGRGQFLDLSGIYMDKKNRLYIADKKNNRVEVYQIKPEGKTDIKPPAQRPLEVILIREIPCRTNDIAVDVYGNVYVSSIENNNIEVFDSGGTSKFVFGGEGEDKGKFNDPTNLAVSPNGNIAVSDNKNYRVQVFDSSGVYLFGLGRKGDEKGEFLSPSGLVYDKKGEKLYVSDKKNDRVQVFNKDGVFLNKFGASGNKANQLGSPEDIVLDPDGTIYVTDTGNNRVQIYYTNFVNKSSFGKNGKGKTEFDEPVCISMDTDKKIYVLDKGNNRVQIFDSSAKFIMEFGSFGKGTGQFDAPQGLAVQNLNKQNFIYVTDTGNKRVQIFILHEAPQAPVEAASYVNERETKLSWKKNPESFVEEYYIYKSDELTGDYTFIDKTSDNVFIIPASLDSTLTQPPYYKISAVTPSGIEGALSPPVTDHFILGYNFFKQNKFKEGILNFTKEIELHPDNASAYYYLGIIYFKQDKWQEAENKFNKTIKLQPQNGFAHYYFGAALSRQGSYDKAIFELEEAIKTDKNNFLIYSELGTAYLNKELYNESIEALNNALLLGGTDPKLHYQLGLSYYKKNKYGQAAEELTKYNNIDPKNFNAQYYTGLTYAAQGKNDLAIKAFKEALEIEPQNHEIVFIIGSIYIDQKKYINAIAELKVAVSINAKDPAYRYKLGLAYFFNDEKEAAAGEFDEAIKIDPANPDYHYYLGLTYFDSDMKKALIEFISVVDLNPNYQGVYLKLAALYEKQKQIPDAIDAYQKALNNDPKDKVSINFSLGKLCYEIKDYKQSEKYFNDVIKIDANHTDAYLQLGIAQNIQEKYNDAILSFKKAIALEQNNIKARMLLAFAYSKEQMNKEAVEEYMAILDIDPSNADSYYRTGMIYMHRGLFDKARESFKKAAETNKDNLLYKNALTDLDIFIKKEQENIVKRITPSDPPVVDFTKRVQELYHGTNEYNITDDLYKLFVIFDGLSVYGVTCTARIEEIDLNAKQKELQYPRITLKNKIGNDLDCAVLLSACLEKEGIAVKIITNPSFTIMLINTGASIEEPEKVTGDAKLYVEKDNFIWIPVDVSLFGFSFPDAWKQGVEKYNEYLTMEEKGEMFSVKEYRVHAPEDDPSVNNVIPEIPEEMDIDTKLQADFKVFYKEMVQSLIKKYKDVLKIAPDDLKTRSTLANLYRENNFKDAASMEYEQVLKLDENNITALYFLAEYLLESEVQKYDEALNYFMKIIIFYPQESRAVFEIAEIYYAQDKSKEALEYYQKYSKFNTDDKQKSGSAQLKIGLCYASLGEMQKAIIGLDIFIKEYPEHKLVEDTKKTLKLLKSSE